MINASGDSFIFHLSILGGDRIDYFANAASSFFSRLRCGHFEHAGISPGAADVARDVAWACAPIATAAPAPAVTVVAALPPRSSNPKSQSAETPYSSQIFTMSFAPGIEASVSYTRHACCFMPTRAAACTCVSPLLSLSSFNLVPILIFFAILKKVVLPPCGIQ